MKTKRLKNPHLGLVVGRACVRIDGVAVPVEHAKKKGAKEEWRDKEHQAFWGGGRA